MADIIIIAALATAVFFILRGQLGKLRKGQCAGGCAGCSSCGSCGSCGGHVCAAGEGSGAAPEEKAV